MSSMITKLQDYGLKTHKKNQARKVREEMAQQRE